MPASTSSTSTAAVDGVRRGAADAGERGGGAPGGEEEAGGGGGGPRGPPPRRVGTGDDAPMSGDRPARRDVVIGRIGKVHGIRGEVSVEPRTDEPDRRFTDGAVLRTQTPRG